MSLDNSEIRLAALEQSHYCQDIKDAVFLETYELESFNVEECKELVRSSVKILNHNKVYRDLIIQILTVLDQNRADFLVNEHTSIAFFWSGMGVCEFQITGKEVNHNKRLHISLQTYKTKKRELLDDKRMHRYMMGGVIGTLAIGGIIAVYTLFFRDD